MTLRLSHIRGEAQQDIKQRREEQRGDPDESGGSIVHEVSGEAKEYTHFR